MLLRSMGTVTDLTTLGVSEIEYIRSFCANTTPLPKRYFISNITKLKGLPKY
jgi:hypothetical protein